MSVRGRVVAWAHQHQQAVGVGLVISALALLGIAALVSWGIFKGSPPAADLGPSTAPEPSSSFEPTAAATPMPSPSPTAITGWSPVVIAGISGLNGIAEHNGRLVAAGYIANGSVGSLATSEDGMTWTPVDTSVLDPGWFFSIEAGQPGFISEATRHAVPMGMPEHAYLYSDDGRTWHEAVSPPGCFAGVIEAYEDGFIGLGGECRTEGDFRPSALHIIISPDGRSWSSQIKDEVPTGDWATDGHRLVLFEQITGQGNPEIWISDDAAQNWRHVTGAFPAGISASGLMYGHGRFLAPAARVSPEGDPDSAVCVSADGESWDCEVIPPLDGELAGRNWLWRPIAVTPTGYVSLGEYFKNPFPPYDFSTEMVAASSIDGLHWTFEAVPELNNKLPTDLVWTTYGLFAWGGTNPNLRPGDISAPYIDVYRAALP